MRKGCENCNTLMIVYPPPPWLMFEVLKMSLLVMDFVQTLGLLLTGPSPPDHSAQQPGRTHHKQTPSQLNVLWKMPFPFLASLAYYIYASEGVHWTLYLPRPFEPVPPLSWPSILSVPVSWVSPPDSLVCWEWWQYSWQSPSLECGHPDPQKDPQTWSL